MKARIDRFADRLLGLLLPRMDAGACVPEHGQLEWRISCGSCGCTGAGRWVRRDCRCRFNCTGSCIDTGETRCVTTQAFC